MGANEGGHEREWYERYNQLNKLLAKKGRSSPYGEGDYWIVDDDWGDNRQMVYVFRIGFLRQELATEVQSLLSRVAPHWGVIFSLEIKIDRTPVPPQGLTVFADRIDEAWNRGALKALFGDDFYWGN